MSAQFDTTPTAEDIEQARARLAAVAQRCTGAGGVYARESAASLVAVELGLLIRWLQVGNAVDARLAAQARALYGAWMEEQ